MIEFFYKSELLDYEILRGLSHILPNWEIRWNDNTKFIIIEEDSFWNELNKLFHELDVIFKSNKYIEEDYHKYEDILADYVKDNLNWNIDKINWLWNWADYRSIIEYWWFKDLNQEYLILSLYWRIQKSKFYGIYRYDDLDNWHRKMIANLISVIIYQRDIF